MRNFTPTTLSATLLLACCFSATATFAVAKEKCDDQTGSAKNVCRADAKTKFGQN